MALSRRGKGSRRARAELKYAYCVLLSGHFQKYCRDLHSEAVDALLGPVTQAALAVVFGSALVGRRDLDRSNAQPNSVRSDFGRFGFDFWAASDLCDAKTPARRRALQELNAWRNAAAHQDFSKMGPSPSLHLLQVRRYRRACDGLATTFDRVLGERLRPLLGKAPW